MPRLMQRDLRAMIPWSTSHAEEVQVQILSLRFDVCLEVKFKSGFFQHLFSQTVKVGLLSGKSATSDLTCLIFLFLNRSIGA